MARLEPTCSNEPQIPVSRSSSAWRSRITRTGRGSAVIATTSPRRSTRSRSSSARATSEGLRKRCSSAGWPGESSDQPRKENRTSAGRSISPAQPAIDGRKDGRGTCSQSPTGAAGRSPSRMPSGAARSSSRPSTGDRPARSGSGRRSATCTPRPDARPRLARGAACGRRDTRERHSRRTRRHTPPHGPDAHAHRRRRKRRDRAAGRPRSLDEHHTHRPRSSHARKPSWPSWPTGAASCKRPRSWSPLRGTRPQTTSKPRFDGDSPRRSSSHGTDAQSLHWNSRTRP